MKVINFRAYKYTHVASRYVRLKRIQTKMPPSFPPACTPSRDSLTNVQPCPSQPMFFGFFFSPPEAIYLKFTKQRKSFHIALNY